MTTRRWWQRSPKWKYLMVGGLIVLPVLVLVGLGLRLIDFERREAQASRTVEEQRQERVLDEARSALRQRVMVVVDRVWSNQQLAVEALSKRYVESDTFESRVALGKFLTEIRPFLRYVEQAYVIHPSGRLLYPVVENPKREQDPSNLQLMRWSLGSEEGRGNDYGSMLAIFEGLQPYRWCISDGLYQDVVAGVRKVLNDQLSDQSQGSVDRYMRLLAREKTWEQEREEQFRWAERARRTIWSTVRSAESLQVLGGEAGGGKREVVAFAPILNRGRVAAMWVARLRLEAILDEWRPQFLEYGRQAGVRARVWGADGRVMTTSDDQWPEAVKGVEVLLEDPRADFLATRIEVALLKGTTSGRDTAQARVWWLGSLLMIVVVVMGLALWWTIRLVGAEMEVARLSSNFVSNVSHELKTPLSVMLLAAEKLALGRVRSAEQAHEYYQLMLAEGQRLKRLIENVLDFSKISAGQKTFHFAPMSVGEVVSQVMKTLHDRLETSGFTATMEIEEGLPDIRGDRDSLTQVIMNLIENSLKYSQERKEVAVRARRRGREILVEIQDRGQGISVQDQQRIFEKFYQVGDALKSEMKGVGLGLAIVQYIMEAHGGRIEVKSELGQGSTFTLVLPVKELEVSHEVPQRS